MSTFLEPDNVAGLTVLETEAEDQYQHIELPEWIRAKIEVTKEPAYTSFKIAKYKDVVLDAPD